MATHKRESVYAALLHGNKEWIETKYVYQYTVPFVLIQFLIGILIIIPMLNIMM